MVRIEQHKHNQQGAGFKAAPLNYMKICLICKKEFKPRRKTHTSCSRSCAMKLKRKLNKKWKTNKGRKFPDRHVVNSPETRLKISIALKGRNIWWAQKIANSRKAHGYKPTLATKLKQRESHLKRVALGLHNNYKGGIEKENVKARKSLEYREWRTAVFERDNFTCQACGANKCYIEADHVLPFCDHPDLRFEVLNGRTLCKPCHKKVTTAQMKEIWRNQFTSNKNKNEMALQHN